MEISVVGVRGSLIWKIINCWNDNLLSSEKDECLVSPLVHGRKVRILNRTGRGSFTDCVALFIPSWKAAGVGGKFKNWNFRHREGKKISMSLNIQFLFYVHLGFLSIASLMLMSEYIFTLCRAILIAGLMTSGRKHNSRRAISRMQIVETIFCTVEILISRKSY